MNHTLTHPKKDWDTPWSGASSTQTLAPGEGCSKRKRGASANKETKTRTEQKTEQGNDQAELLQCRDAQKKVRTNKDRKKTKETQGAAKKQQAHPRGDPT